MRGHLELARNNASYKRLLKLSNFLECLSVLYGCLDGCLLLKCEPRGGFAAGLSLSLFCLCEVRPVSSTSSFNPTSLHG